VIYMNKLITLLLLVLLNSSNILVPETIDTEDIDTFSDYTINNQQIKLQNNSLDEDNLITLFNLSGPEFQKYFNYSDASLQDRSNVGGYEGAIYIEESDLVFYYPYDRDILKSDTKNLFTLSGKYYSENPMYVLLENGEKILPGITSDELTLKLGEPQMRVAYGIDYDNASTTLIYNIQIDDTSKYTLDCIIDDESNILQVMSCNLINFEN